MMQPSDIEGIAQRGVAARKAGVDYFENPFLLQNIAADWSQIGSWTTTCAAWWSGWRKEDEGRTERIHRLLKIRSW